MLIIPQKIIDTVGCKGSYYHKEHSAKDKDIIPEGPYRPLHSGSYEIVQIEGDQKPYAGSSRRDQHPGDKAPYLSVKDHVRVQR